MHSHFGPNWRCDMRATHLGLYVSADTACPRPLCLVAPEVEVTYDNQIHKQQGGVSHVVR